MTNRRVGSLIVMLLALTGCVFGERDLEDLECDGQGRCYEGYVCVEGQCLDEQEVLPDGGT